MTTLLQMTFYIYIFVMMFCDSGRQIIFQIAAMSFGIFFVNYFGYGITMDLSFIISNTILVILGAFVLSMLGMMSMYVSEQHERRLKTDGDNLKLLDGMHEGLFILAKDQIEDNPKVLFINNPVQKLIKTLMLNGNCTNEN